MRCSVSHVRFVAATPDQQRLGLLGYVSFVLADSVVIDGITLRRTRVGRLVLSLPVRHDSRGGQHAIIRPINDATRRELEEQVFAALGIKRTESAP